MNARQNNALSTPALSPSQPSGRVHRELIDQTPLFVDEAGASAVFRAALVAVPRHQGTCNSRTKDNLFSEKNRLFTRENTLFGEKIGGAARHATSEGNS
jgi:hypothetical protein